MLLRLCKGEDSLDLSIQKWQDIVDGNTADLGSVSCALCERYFKMKGWLGLVLRCVQCPVREKTHQAFCRGTPLINYEDAKSVAKDENLMRMFARQELEFLKALRKEAQEKKE